MLTIPFILAAGSLPTLISGAPIPFSPFSEMSAEVSSHSLLKRTYTVVGGNGKVAEGWPSMSSWFSSFDEMFAANEDVMKSSCTQWGVDNNSAEEIQSIKDSITSVSSSSGVDARFILAIIMQESNGCVRAPTTNNGVINPGLMQSHNGAGSCNSLSGEVQTPCPASQILQMIKDGTEGTSSGDGLKGCLALTGTTGVEAYYQAARIYNSGSIDSSGNLGLGIATHCYSSDIANRLTGWSNGPSSCDPNVIGQLTSAVGAFAQNAGLGASDTTDTTTTTTTASPTTTTSTTTATITSTTTSTSTVTVVHASTTTAAATTTAASVPTTTAAVPAASTSSAAPSATASSTAPIYPYAISSCQEYYTVVSGDYCLKVESEAGITAAQLLAWNAGLDEPCSNLWLGYQYCVKA